MKSLQRVSSRGAVVVTLLLLCLCQVVHGLSPGRERHHDVVDRAQDEVDLIQHDQKRKDIEHGILIGSIKQAEAKAGLENPSTVRDVPKTPSGNDIAARTVFPNPNLPDPGDPPNGQWNKGVGGPWMYGEYEYYCGIFATGVIGDLSQEWNALDSGNGKMCSAPAKSCARQICRETTGVYICNDNDFDISIPCDNVYFYTLRLADLCCDDNSGKSGQMFAPQGDGYNVIVGYANCNYDTGPYPPGEGNNPRCEAGSGQAPWGGRV